MGIGVLGPLRVDGHADGLSPRDRVVLSALVVRAREPVSTESLADALWGEVPPASWSKVVYGCVSRLRKLLGPAAIDKAPAGYLLTLGDDELDHRLFERLLERGREALAGNDPARASFLVEEALGLWRGRALLRRRGVGAGAGRGCPARGPPDGGRGAAHRGGGTSWSWAGGPGAGSRPRGAGAVPRAALVPARHLALPVRTAA